ncbi:glycosyltransferase, partial [Streptomyces scabiei]
MSTVIMSYYNELKKNKIHADLIANEVIERDFRNSFESNRDKVFLLHNRKKNPLGYALKVKKILENGNYDIVHIHGNSATLILELFAIRKIKIIKVVHGHGVTTSHPIIHSM